MPLLIQIASSVSKLPGDHLWRC